MVGWGVGGGWRDKTERVTGLGRITKEEIVKWNQMTALRFQTGGRHQTFLASLCGINTRDVSMPVFQPCPTDHSLPELWYKTTGHATRY